jgi:hypothetical protein
MPCIYIAVLLQNPFNPGKSSYGSPFDSTYGMPASYKYWTYAY